MFYLLDLIEIDQKWPMQKISRYIESMVQGEKTCENIGIPNNKQWNLHQHVMFRNIYIIICGNETRLPICTRHVFIIKPFYLKNGEYQEFFIRLIDDYVEDNILPVIKYHETHLYIDIISPDHGSTLSYTNLIRKV